MSSAVLDDTLDDGLCDRLKHLRERLQQSRELLDETHWDLFDRLLHLLDSSDEGAAVVARDILERLVCGEALSPKEQLLKGCEALTWVVGQNAICFVLGLVARSLKVVGNKRNAREVLEAMRRSVSIAGGNAIEEEEEEEEGKSRVKDDEPDQDNGVDGGSEERVCEESVAVLYAAHAAGADEIEVLDVLFQVWEWLRIQSQETEGKAADLVERLSDRGDLLSDLEGRGVMAIEAAVRLGRGRQLLPLVWTPEFALKNASECVRGSLKAYGEGHQDKSKRKQLSFRASRAVALGKRLAERCGEERVVMSLESQRWMNALLKEVARHSGTHGSKDVRTATWQMCERLLDACDLNLRAYCLVELLNGPLSSIAALACTRIKTDLLKSGKWRQWWPICVNQLFPVVYKPPKDAGELAGRHDVYSAALNVLLFLTIRSSQLAKDEADMIVDLRGRFIPPLEKVAREVIMQASQPVDLEAQNEQLAKMPGAPKWTEETLKTSMQRSLVAAQLLMSVIARIEDFAK